jgi:hypothetical protein
MLLTDKAFTQMGCKYTAPTPYTPVTEYCKQIAKEGTSLKLPILSTTGKDMTKQAQDDCCSTPDFWYWDDLRELMKCPPRTYKPGYTP